MKSKKYLAIIALLLVCITVFSLFAACEKAGNQQDTSSGESGDSSENESSDNPSHSSDNNQGNDDSDDTFSPLDPSFVPDIDKTYIIDPVINNSYDGINRYIGAYDFPAPEQIAVPDGRAVSDIVGAANVGGKYNFTQLPYLTEGAEMVAHDLGSSVYRFAMGPDYKEVYTFNHNWSDVYSLKELAQTSAYSQIFSNSDLKTFVISATEFNRLAYEKVATENKDPNYFTQDYVRVTNEFYDLAKYLLQTYGSQNKTFIISTADGDEVFGQIYDQCTINGGATQQKALAETYYRYLNARQNGINKAVAEVKASKAKVYGCIEINTVSYGAYSGSTSSVARRLIDAVIPHTNADLYSFNNNYTPLGYKDLVSELNTLLSKIPNPNPDFDGKKNIIIGGISYASNVEGASGQLNAIASNVIQAVEWGVQYVVYDSYFCTTRTDSSLDDRPTNGNMAGCWLVCPDGSYAPIFWYLKGLNDGKDYMAKTPLLRLEVIE